jgi:hypothetical protein
VLLPSDTVRLVRASEFTPIIGDGSAPATVPPANVQKLHASSIKDLHNPSVLATAARTFSRNYRPLRLRHVIQQLSQQPEAAHPRPRPAAERASHHRAGKCVQPLVPQQAAATNAAALLLALAAALPFTTADLLNAPRSIRKPAAARTPTNGAECTTPSYAATIRSS